VRVGFGAGLRLGVALGGAGLGVALGVAPGVLVTGWVVATGTLTALVGDGAGESPTTAAAGVEPHPVRATAKRVSGCDGDTMLTAHAPTTPWR